MNLIKLLVVLFPTYLGCTLSLVPYLNNLDPRSPI